MGSTEQQVAEKIEDCLRFEAGGLTRATHDLTLLLARKVDELAERLAQLERAS